jgi:hypothetical protein
MPLSALVLLLTILLVAGPLVGFVSVLLLIREQAIGRRLASRRLKIGAQLGWAANAVGFGGIGALSANLGILGAALFIPFFVLAAVLVVNAFRTT